MGNSAEFRISVNEFRISVNEIRLSINEFWITENNLNFRYRLAIFLHGMLAIVQSVL